MSVAGRGRLLIALVVTAGVLNLVDRQIIAVLKPRIAADLGWDDDDYGTLAAWFQAGAAAGFLASGWVVDRLGVRWANPVGVGAWSVAALLHGVVRGFPSFLGARVALGATEAMGTPAAVKTIAELLPPVRRSAGYGIANACNSLGAILAPLLIPAVALAVGWRGTFVAAGVAGLVWTALWLLASRGIGQEARPVIGAAAAPLFRDRRTWAIAGAKLLSDATWWLLLFWLPDFFHRRFGMDGLALGAPLAIAYSGAAVGSLAGGIVPGRLLVAGYTLERVRKGALLVGALCVAPISLALAASGPVAATALMALALAGHQIFSTNLFALVADVVPAERVGRVTAFGSFSGNVGGIAVAKATGILLAAGAGYRPMLLFASFAYLAALGWIQWLLPRLVASERAGPSAAWGRH